MNVDIMHQLNINQAVIILELTTELHRYYLVAKGHFAASYNMNKKCDWVYNPGPSLM